MIIILAIDDSSISSGNVPNEYRINAVYKSTVILPCHLKLNTKPVWFHNQSRLDLKACSLLYSIAS